MCTNACVYVICHGVQGSGCVPVHVCTWFVMEFRGQDVYQCMCVHDLSWSAGVKLCTSACVYMTHHGMQGSSSEGEGALDQALLQC